MKLIALGVISALLALLVSSAPKHGNERIVVPKKKDDMQFKSFTPNETGDMFKTTKGEDMNITMQSANVSMDGYVSQEVKDQQVFKFYNNTNFYVSFSEKAKQAASSIRDLAKNVVIEELLKHPDKISKAKVKKVFKDHVVIELGQISELKTATELLQSKIEILAMEYFMKRRIFGRRADIGEMAKFRSKVKRDAVIYDPEVEKQKQEESRKIEREKEEADRKAKEDEKKASSEL